MDDNILLACDNKIYNFYSSNSTFIEAEGTLKDANVLFSLDDITIMVGEDTGYIEIVQLPNLTTTCKY